MSEEEVTKKGKWPIRIATKHLVKPGESDSGPQGVVRLHASSRVPHALDKRCTKVAVSDVSAMTVTPALA